MNVGRQLANWWCNHYYTVRDQAKKTGLNFEDASEFASRVGRAVLDKAQKLEDNDRLVEDFLTRIVTDNDIPKTLNETPTWHLRYLLSCVSDDEHWSPVLRGELARRTDDIADLMRRLVEIPPDIWAAIVRDNLN